MLTISWTKNKSNDKLLKEAAVQHMLMKIIQQQQQHTFLGHVSKNHGLKNLAVSGKIEERRVSGHQRLKYLDICVHCGKIT